MYYNYDEPICPICKGKIKHPYTGEVLIEQLEEDMKSCLWIEVCDESGGCLGYTAICKKQKDLK